MKKNAGEDDFANDPEIVRIRKEQAAYDQMIRDCYDLIAGAFEARSSSFKNLKEFVLYQTIELPSIGSAMSGYWNNQPVYFSSIRYYSSVQTGRSRLAGHDLYLIGLVQLRQSYPHIIIQPETLGLKIGNLVTKMDVDFDHAKWFSFRYYVTTKDKPALEKLFETRDLNKLSRFSDLEIEFLGNRCFFRTSRKPISIKETMKLIKLGKLLAELF